MSTTKTFLLAALFTCLAGVSTMSASAMYFDCGTQLFVGGVGSGTNSCPAAPAGLLALPGGVQSVTLYYQADYLNGSSGSNTADVTFTPAAGTWGTAPVPYTVAVTGTNGSTTGCYISNGWTASAPTATGFGPDGNGPTTCFSEGLPALVTSGFTVSVAGTMVAGTVSDSDGHNIVAYDYTIPQTGTPEPTTLALVGSALIGLGLMGRKRLSR